VSCILMLWFHIWDGNVKYSALNGSKLSPNLICY
jgi:hypothetical protein